MNDFIMKYIAKNVRCIKFNDEVWKEFKKWAYDELINYSGTPHSSAIFYDFKRNILTGCYEKRLDFYGPYGIVKIRGKE